VVQTSITERFLLALVAVAVALPAKAWEKATYIKLDFDADAGPAFGTARCVADLGGNLRAGARKDIYAELGTPDVERANSNVGHAGPDRYLREATPAAVPRRIGHCSNLRLHRRRAFGQTAPMMPPRWRGLTAKVAARADSIDLGTLSLVQRVCCLRNDRPTGGRTARDQRPIAGVIQRRVRDQHRMACLWAAREWRNSIAMSRCCSKRWAGRFHGTGDCRSVLSLALGVVETDHRGSLSGIGAVLKSGWPYRTGIDLDALMGNFDAEAGRLVFDSLAGHSTWIRACCAID